MHRLLLFEKLSAGIDDEKPDGVGTNTVKAFIGFLTPNILDTVSHIHGSFLAAPKTSKAAHALGRER